MIGCQKHIAKEDAVTWRIINGREVKLFTKPIINAEYTRRKLGPRDYSKPANNNPKSVCGYCPRILQRKMSKNAKEYL